jgi:glycosyltransferase involved in cell wall biosynthesis
MDLPNISILMPTYNRRKFLPFIIRNLKIQDYPHKKLQLVIHDDGEEPLIEDYTTFKNSIHPIKLKYIRNKNKCSIGEKRNLLVQNANNNIVVFMDDDDMYEPTYISHSYETLKTNKAGCAGCNKMIILYPPYTKDDFYAIDCGNNKRLIHEATLMFHKSWYDKTKGFDNTSKAEGLGLFAKCKLKDVALTNPYLTMTAIVHGNNTISKDKFKGNNNLADMFIHKQTTDFIIAVCA